MTNEELAELIQNGDDGYLPELWGQVRKLIRMKAEQYHRHFSMNGGGNYSVDVDDLTQCGYYAVLDAVKYYSPGTGYKFTTYLQKTLKNAFREALGMRSSKRDPCFAAASLDVPFGEDDDTPLLDMIDSHDSSLLNVEESVYNQELRREINAALQTLTEAEREVITLHFFFGVTFQEQADRKGVSRAAVANYEYSALERIRRNPSRMRSLAEFMPDYGFDPYKATGFTAWTISGRSVQEEMISRLDQVAAGFLI